MRKGRKVIHHERRTGKAAWEDDICVKQIKHFETVAKDYIFRLFNSSLKSYQMSKLWTKSKIVILKATILYPFSATFTNFTKDESSILHRTKNIVDIKLSLHLESPA